jgi:hypothetical protein
MRASHAATAILGAMLVGGPGPSAAQPSQAAVCPSLPLAQQAAQAQQSPGTPLPDGCRMVGVRRVETPSGPVCAVDFSESGQGLFTDLLDASVQTRWWTVCSNLP